MQAGGHGGKIVGKGLAAPKRVIYPHVEADAARVKVCARNGRILPRTVPDVPKVDGLKVCIGGTVGPVQGRDITVSAPEKIAVHAIAVLIKARGDNGIPHAAKRQLLLPVLAKGEMSLAVEGEELAHMRCLPSLCVLGPIAVPSAVFPVRGRDRFSIDGRRKSDGGIEVIPVEVDGKEHVGQSGGMQGAYQVLGHGNIRLGRLTLGPVSQVFPVLHVKLDRIEPERADLFRREIDKVRIIEGGAVEVPEPQTEKGFSPGRREIHCTSLP